MLDYVNLFLILIILTVLIIDSVFIVKLRKHVKELDTKVANGNSLLDLSEFTKLDGDFKKHYKTHVVNGLMPPLMNIVNSEIKKNNINDYLTKNEKEINEYIKVFTDEINSNLPTGTTTPTISAAPTTINTQPFVVVHV